MGAASQVVAQASRKGGGVEAALLREVASWHEMLAGHGALRNSGFDARELNLAVGQVIVRLLFIRMCEERDPELHRQLRPLSEGEDFRGRLCELFRLVDHRYHLGLLHFNLKEGAAEPYSDPTTRLVVDDQPLREIIRWLYDPASSDELSVLPADILGRVYEQCLGKAVQLPAADRVARNNNPSARKARGIYYTPAFIVDHVVHNTVGKLVEGLSPREVAGLRVLDPACGSGSFLLGAFQFLLDWHRDWYVADGASKHTDQIYTRPDGQHGLTSSEKRRILLGNIYGVDIDLQAVEVASLSLLLMALEKSDRGIPDLRDNIKCGNAIVAPDFYDLDNGVIDEEDRRRVNPFDWQSEFPEAFEGRDGGFDAVIGNPPWGQKTIAADDRIKQYARRIYPSTKGIYDLFRPFVEQSIRIARPGRFVGLVLPDIVLLKDYPTTRKLMLDELSLEAIDWWGQAFGGAVIDAATIVGRRGPAPDQHVIRVQVHDRKATSSQNIRQDVFLGNPRYLFNVRTTPARRGTLKRLAKYPTLGDVCEIHEGVHSGNIRSELFVDARLDDTCEELIFGRDEIVPYVLRWRGKYVRLGAMLKERTPQRYANAGHSDWYDRDKLLVRRTGDYVLSAIDRRRRYASNNFFIVFPKAPGSLCLEGLCAVLNSRLMTWFFRAIEPRQGRAFAELKIKHLKQFPLPSALVKPGGDTDLRALCKKRTQCGLALLGEAAPDDIATLNGQRARLDDEINSRVLALLGVKPGEIGDEANFR